MKYTKILSALALAGGIATLVSAGPAQSAAISTVLQHAPGEFSRSADLIPVHGRGVRGRHCGRAWHPRRGWHRHPRACKRKWRKRWRRHHRWERGRGCYFYRGHIHCRFF